MNSNKVLWKSCRALSLHDAFPTSTNTARRLVIETNNLANTIQRAIDRGQT
jgi:hypothetical protein